MVDSTSRALIFWGVCIPLRSYLTLRAKDNREDWLRLFALAIGTRWVTGGEVGNEGVFGGPAFWKDERPLHGVLCVLRRDGDVAVPRGGHCVRCAQLAIF